LPEEEAHHALRVARLREGDPVLLFDGAGREFDARLTRVSKREAWVQIEGARRVPEPMPRMQLIQAWLHRDKCIEEIILRGTELGVARFVFFRAGHSEKAPKVQDKWRRIAVESCKQCGRLWLPEFEVADDLAAALNGVEGRILIAAMDRPPVSLREAVGSGEDLALVVGPEGDFTAAEMDLALARGAYPISLGTTVFRAEVAATLFATIVAYELGRLG
jgi:16S rRNA (uracil1498-N3)-methyltransferase